MTFSGLTLHYAMADLNLFLPARIQKIQVLSHDQFVIHLYHKEPIKWYLNLSSQNAKMHRTHLDMDVKSEPTVFVNRLKKWLINAQLMPFKQVSKDRIIYADIKTKNALFDPVTLRLYLEFFGKDANLILTDENNKIIDCLKTSGALFSHPRLIQIGATYQLPNVTKHDPFDEQAVSAFFQAPTEMTTYFDGFSKTIAEALSHHSEKTFIQALKNPVFVKESKIPLFHEGPSLPFVAWADGHLTQAHQEKPYDQKRIEIQKRLFKRLERALKKRTVLTLEQSKVSLAEELIMEGQGLMASPYKNDKLSSLEVTDYENNQTVTVQLNPLLTVLENAQVKFKKAKKLKASVPHLKKQMALNEKDIQYYELLLYQLEDATQDSLEGIYKELMKEKIISTKAPVKKSKKSTGKILETGQGHSIYIGLNNEQNAYLTHEKAKPSEYFAHVRGYPGSHVILAASDPSIDEMKMACEVAAYYSKARPLIEVDVDITKVKYVKKIPGHHGCFVRYDHAQTYSVKPINHEKKAQS